MRFAVATWACIYLSYLVWWPAATLAGIGDVDHLCDAATKTDTQTEIKQAVGYAYASIAKGNVPDVTYTLDCDETPKLISKCVVVDAKGKEWTLVPVKNKDAPTARIAVVDKTVEEGTWRKKVTTTLYKTCTLSCYIQFKAFVHC